MTLLLRLLINAAALWLSARIIDGIAYSGSWTGLLAVALIFGAVNTFIRPVLKLLSFPITVVTLGLFALVINAGMLMLTSAIARNFDLAFSVSGFVPALFGAVVISIVSAVLNLLFVRDDD
jgi:putative membrane protein